MSNRWWGPRSDFPWEEEALKYIRDQMPTTEPYRAWQTFTFTAKSGHVRELDLFIAAPAGLFLVEIKSHPGRATNNGSTWMFHDKVRRTRPFENPLHLTDQKAKELKSQLQWAAAKLGIKVRIPFIRAAVFLSAPNLRCEFDEIQRLNVYGRDGLQDQTGLPGIWTDLLGAPARSERDRVDVGLSRKLDDLRQTIGVSGLRKHRKVGPYELAPRAFETGPSWEDYLAENTAMPGDQPRRIRIYLSELGASHEDRESRRRAARREYLALQGISHEGIVQAEQFSDEHEAGPAIVFRHGKDWRRLDYFIAEHGAALPVETRLDMIRQLAEALDHAHRRRLYNRALAARSVYVEMDGRYPRLRIGDWQVSARPDAGSSGRPSALTLASGGGLAAHVEGAAGAYLAPEFGSPDAEAAQLDVFGIGALSHLILTCRPPAPTRAELAERLRSARALVPSAVTDDISPVMDDLVRGATAVQPADRFETIREFLDGLERIEEELTAPEVPDLLDAKRNTITVDGWRVERVLGKGSTARALLVTKDGLEQVYKVALNQACAERLEYEAAQLHDIHDSHIVRLIKGPVQMGTRTVLVLERAGEQTLGEYLKSHGRLTIDDLENLGTHLFQAIGYLADQGVWHRDIKPANLAIRELLKKGRRLVLFDFSLAGAADRAIEVGTAPYLDPFLGTDRRPAYDDAAELYAVAVTLHEMASADLPSWGDGVVEPRLLPPSEQLPQLAEDSFDPLLRDRLVGFFRTALHRDRAKRHASRKDMERAWSDLFRDLDETLPATTRHTVHEQLTDPAQAREVSAALVEASTSLLAAGLSARAESIALQQFDVSTVGELARIQGKRIQRLRGVGLSVRNELVRRGREWREQLDLSERIDVVPVERSIGELSRLSLDEVADRLVPKVSEGAETRIIRAVLALPDPDVLRSPVTAWAPQAEVARDLEVTPGQVRDHLHKARERWRKSVPAVTGLRTTVLEILTLHGRVMEAEQLALALLAARGSELDNPAARLALARACVRAAVETEEQLESPRLVKRRLEHPGHAQPRLLIAQVAEDDPSAPTEEELLDYGVELGRAADVLVAVSGSEPLPGVSGVREALTGVARPDGMPPLADTDLVSLAAGAANNAAATARLELYPRDLDAKKALRLAQAAGYLGDPGIEPEKLRARVLARFPELTGLPIASDLRTLLREMGYDVDARTGEDGVIRYVLPGTRSSSKGTPSRWTGSLTGPSGATPRDEARLRLVSGVEHGGFLAVKSLLAEAMAVRDELAALPRVTPVHVTHLFVAALRDQVTAQGRPKWETVLAADSPDSSPAARSGFARLVDAAWQRLDDEVKSLPGIVLLHDATPLARYTGGMEQLARLAASARRARQGPHGLWLLCPMDDPRDPARLDEEIVGALGENEQLAVPPGFLNDDLRSES